tara:strand:+ start:335 stop:580 length:246 start_codon:yes stop_codon:yes gene_type:complete
MNTKTIYALNQAGSEGDYMGPFFENEDDAKKSLEKKKAESHWPADIWVTKETLIFENKENTPPEEDAAMVPKSPPQHRPRK